MHTAENKTHTLCLVVVIVVLISFVLFFSLARSISSYMFAEATWAKKRSSKMT